MKDAPFKPSGFNSPLIAALLVAGVLVGACASPGKDAGAPKAGTQTAATTAQGSPANDRAEPAQRDGADTPAKADGSEPPARESIDPAVAQALADSGGAPLPPHELTPQLLFQLLASEIAVQRGEVGSAAVTYLNMARQTRDPRLARRATELALGDRALDRALPAAQLWHELAPDSPVASQTIETLWLTTGRFDEAEPLLRARLERARAEQRLPDTYAQLQRVLARSSDRKAAFTMLERLSAPDRQMAAARLALAAVANAADDPQRAAAEADAALAIEPDNEQAAIALAQYTAHTPAGAQTAIGKLQAFVERMPKEIEARFALARLLAASGRENEAHAQFEAALKQEPDSPVILFSLAQLAYQTKQPQLAEQYLKRYLDLPEQVQRDNNPVWLFLGQLAEEAKRNDEAIGWYARVRRGEQFLPALSRHALLLGKTGRVDEARELLRNSSVSNARERLQLTSIEAQVLREAGRHAEAFEVLTQALEKQPENPELLYDHAMAAEKIDRLDLMEKNLRRLMELRPDYAHAYNALGYTFADRNMRLEEAQALIEKALTLSPDDAHILDSMGWVLFKRGELDRSAEYLRKAYAQQPDAEIAAHLGEVLWKMGQLDEARRFWREAMLRDPQNSTLKETLARLNVTP